MKNCLEQSEYTLQLARLCKAASDPFRLMILRVLLNNSFSVLELTQLFDITQSGMSHHLKILLTAGLVVTKREGNTIFYCRTLVKEQAHDFFHQALFNEIDQLIFSSTLKQRIDQLYEVRSQVSRDFFTQLVEQGVEQQDVIAGIAQYQEPLLKLLSVVSFNKEAIVLEIGPGKGLFLPLLAERFKQVIAVDNSKDMLALAQKYCQSQCIDNVKFKLQDATLLDMVSCVDCMVINMVLHHLPAPAEALQRFSQYLKPTGSLFLTELCHHEQAWAKTVCGDVWLGFEPDELTHWAKRAGLQANESLYIGLRNGFQLQIRRFYRQ